MDDDSKSSKDAEPAGSAGSEKSGNKDASLVSSGNPFQNPPKPSGSLADAQQQRYMNRALNRATATNIPAFVAEELDAIGQKPEDGQTKEHFDKTRSASNSINISRSTEEPSYYAQHPFISLVAAACAIAIPSFLYTLYIQKDANQKQLLSSADSRMNQQHSPARRLQPHQGPGFGTFYMNRANLDIFGHKYVQALGDLKTAMQRDPDNKVQYLSRMADVFVLLKDNKGVAAASGAVLVLEPKNVTALLQRAKANYALGNKLSARDDFYRAIQLSPRDASAYLARADYFFAEKQLLSAVDDYKKALQLDATLVPAKKMVATIEAQQKRLVHQAQARVNAEINSDSDSIQPALTASELQSLKIKDVDKLRQLATTALSHHKVDYAVAALRQCVILNPNDAPSRKLLAYALISAGDASGAFDQFNAWDTLVGAGLEEQLAFARALANVDDAQTLTAFLNYIVDNHATSADALLRIAQVADRAGCTAAVDKAVNLGLKMSAGPLRYQFLVEMRRVQTNKIGEEAEARKTGFVTPSGVIIKRTPPEKLNN